MSRRGLWVPLWIAALSAGATGILAVPPRTASAVYAAAEPPRLTDSDEQLAARWSEVTLPADSEEGFRRFIAMAQAGELGEDVTNANVNVYMNHARIELVRAGGPPKRLLLTPKSTATTESRYFDLWSDEMLTGEELRRVAAALDHAFDGAPFHSTYGFFNAQPGDAPIPSLTTAWTYSGWPGIVRTLQRRMVALASLTYTGAVIAALVVAISVSVAVLWVAKPPVTAKL